MDKSIRNSGIFGIMSLFILMLILLFEVLKNFNMVTSEYIFVIAYLISMILYVLFMRGFILIGNTLNLPFLVVMSYVLIGGDVILTLIQILTPIFPQFDGFLYQIIISFMFGAISIPFGISLLKLNEDFGGIATAAGVLNIIVGASLITVLLSFVGALLLIPTWIIEIMLLFNASKKL